MFLRSFLNIINMLECINQATTTAKKKQSAYKPKDTVNTKKKRKKIKKETDRLTARICLLANQVNRNHKHLTFNSQHSQGIIKN